MPGCCVPFCKNSNWRKMKSKGVSGVVSIHNFPVEKKTRKAWMAFCGIGSKTDVLSNKNLYKVCSIHFDKNCFERDLKAELTGTKPKNKLILNCKSEEQ